MPRSLEATYRIVTPMFVGDANQRATSVRPPSVKGALRFWWRALEWSWALKRSGGDVAVALRDLAEIEGRLFGSAAGERNGAGQARALLSVTQPSPMRFLADWPRYEDRGSSYLGYGISASGNRPHRDGIAENVELGVRLTLRPDVTRVEAESLAMALHAWGLFGGLGSRARRGFGSVSLVSLRGDDLPEAPGLPGLTTEAQYSDRAARMLSTASGVTGYPPFTAFSSRARFAVIERAADPGGSRRIGGREAHDMAGRDYLDYRGRSSKLRGRDKIPFGLPLKNADEKCRRASPLFFHVHALTEGLHVTSVLFMPSVFHHEYPQRSAGDLDEFYRVVNTFIDGYEK